jgi:hypothetical protein
LGDIPDPNSRGGKAGGRNHCKSLLGHPELAFHPHKPQEPQRLVLTVSVTLPTGKTQHRGDLVQVTCGQGKQQEVKLGRCWLHTWLPMKRQAGQCHYRAPTPYPGLCKGSPARIIVVGGALAPPGVWTQVPADSSVSRTFTQQWGCQGSPEHAGKGSFLPHQCSRPGPGLATWDGQGGSPTLNCCGPLLGPPRHPPRLPGFLPASSLFWIKVLETCECSPCA